MNPGDLYIFPAYSVFGGPELESRVFVYFSHNVKVFLLGSDGGVRLVYAKRILNPEEWTE